MNVYLICRSIGVPSTVQSLGYPIGQAFPERTAAMAFIAQSAPEENLFWTECHLQEPDLPYSSLPPDEVYFEQWDLMWQGSRTAATALN